MFDLCFIGENVVEEDAVVEYRMTKAVKKFIEKGADTFYVCGDASFTPIALKVCLQERRENKDLRYFSFPVIDKAEWKVRQYRETIDSCQVIICYYDPAKNSSADNLFFNYAREQKKRIVNLFQGESHYLHGQPLEELEQMIHKWIELLKNG